MANQQIDNIEDINEAINPITPPIDGQEGLEMLGHNRNQPVVLSRFSRSFFKIYSHLISLHSSVKNLGQNKLDKGGYDGTALELKNWLVANYTTLMNNIRDTLTNMINLKLPHGGYNGSGQQLKNEIDTKVSKSGDTMTGLLQMNAPIQSAGYMSDHGAIANLGGGSFRFGTAGLNWRIGVKGSDGHLGVWTQQDDTILFQPYNFSPEGRLTAQGGLILPQSNQASINVKGICGGYNQAVGFNCGLNVSNANGALDALVVPKDTSTFTPMSKIQTVTEGVGYTTRYVMGTLSTEGNYGRYQLLAFGDDPGNLLSSWTWDMNDGTFETNKLKVHGTSTFSTEIVSSAHTMLRSSVTGMHLHSNGNAIGFLSSSGGWIFRVDQVTGEVISGYNSVTMPTGLRMYSAGDSIGFLGTDTNWKLRIDNNGNTFSEGKVDAKGGKMEGYLNSLVGDYAGFKSTSSGVLENRYASGISWNDTPTNSGFDIKAELGLLRPNTNPGDWGKITLSSIVNRDTGTVKTWEFGMQDGSFNCPGVVTSQGSEVLTFANANRYCPHRVGDIIESTSAEHPASTWLGTGWERYGNGMVVVGVSEGEREFASAGQTGGAKYVSLTAAQNGPHEHHVTTVTAGNGWYGQGGNLGGFGAVATGASGNGEAHNNIQPYVTLYRWIRVS
ncbi:MAG: phage baseplate protein [Clostridium sp.]|uniref:phage baseplate protein n=2 Tax=Bacteria TaxID=2 RepID=UPI003EE7E024